MYGYGINGTSTSTPSTSRLRSQLKGKGINMMPSLSLDMGENLYLIGKGSGSYLITRSLSSFLKST